MKRAIVSDIHGNIEALEAVLADIAQQTVDSIYCLGDIVGYGPNPRECIDRVLSFDQSILGNHDQGALYDPEGFSSGAERAIFWTRDQLEMPNGDPEQTAKRWRFLSELPRTVREGPFTFVHGSVRNPLSEYVFPEDVHNPKKLERLFAMIERYAFQGHTHVPGAFAWDQRRMHQLRDETIRIEPGRRYLVNVGSVGQPRDGDPRAAYLLIDEERGALTHVRLPYDVQAAMRRIQAAGLPAFLAERLQWGE